MGNEDAWAWEEPGNEAGSGAGPENEAGYVIYDEGSHIGLLLSTEEEEEMRKVFRSPLTVSSRTA